mmetsp:Transcript_11467/g.16956  ORF Transcript_11467/g.16956 Transcript_11467/m.16956 type:complete len:128 (+) Transcript_11467:359-742(+)
MKSYTKTQIISMLEINEFPDEMFGKHIKVTGTYTREEKLELRNEYIRWNTKKRTKRLQPNPDFLRELQNERQEAERVRKMFERRMPKMEKENTLKKSIRQFFGKLFSNKNRVATPRQNAIRPMIYQN